MEILIFLLLPVITFASTTTVVTQSGVVIGSTVYYNGKSVNRFLGIPYAQPPVGDLRFKKPVPIQNWSQPLVADTFSPSCKQEYPFDYPWVDRMPGDSEDCLYLNIWVPESASPKDPKAVMFYIHGGGLSTGSSRLPLYDGQVLAAEGDVIVVTINYRLGIFGFLSALSKDAPGNMGLHDILEALKWINKNIEAFGGDKNKITLFGNDAGGTISLLFTVSPLTIGGLFKRIIQQSGTIVVKELGLRRKNLDLGQKVAKAVGCATDQVTLRSDPNAVIACLREKDADLLIKTERSFAPTALSTFNVIFQDEFLPLQPRAAITAGVFQRVDFLAGAVKDEGSIWLVTTAPELFGPYGELDPKINKTKGGELIRQMFKDQILVKDAVAFYYLFGLNEYDYDKIRSQVYHSQGDSDIHCPLLYYEDDRFLRLITKKTYFYYFEHQDFNPLFAPWMGVVHYSETPYVFGRPLENPSQYSDGEAELSKTLIQAWTSFAKDGVPSLDAGRAPVEVPEGSTCSWWTTINPFRYNARNQCLKSSSSPSSTSWKQFPHIQEFYVVKPEENYLKQHNRNCLFFRTLKPKFNT